jgi:hypothetical protein
MESLSSLARSLADGSSLARSLIRLLDRQVVLLLLLLLPVDSPADQINI